MIKPTVGRVVWFRPGIQYDHPFVPGQPLAALVTFVWSDTYVNLVVFDADGNPHSETSVYLVQEGNEVPSSGNYAEWMPYQKSVAKGDVPPTLHAVPA